MLNTQKYDYTELELPNILFQWDRATTARPHTVTHQFLEPLITKIAKAKPKWTLVGTHKAYRTEAPEWVSRFLVYENGQELGTISLSYSYGRSCNVFTIDNKRMSQKRIRGAETQTQDLSRAYKIITKEFYPKTTEELLDEAKGKLGSLISGKFRVTLGAKQYARSPVFGKAEEYVQAHWGDYEKFLLENGVLVEQIERYHTTISEYEAVQTVHSPHSAGNGSVVVIRATDYLVCSSAGNKSFTQSELPTYFRTKIGMLQLVEDGSVIPNVGARVSDTIMYVVPEEKGDE